VSKLDALLEKVADEQDALRAQSGAVARVAGRVERALPPRRRRLPAALLLAAAFGAVALLFGARALLGHPPLTVSVGGSSQAPLVGAWLGAPETRALPLEFSDGSQFELAPASKARVLELGRASARVELASGSLHVHVVPGAATAWHVDAGPFVVRVTGTRFVVSYLPEADQFEVSMEEGQVELSGCVFGSGRKLAVGQRVRASCRTKSLEVSYRDGQSAPAAPAPASTAVAEATEPGPTAPAAVTPSTAPKGAAASSAPAAAPTWLPLARAGKYQDAFAAANRDGFEAQCARASAEELTLLADVARHARAPRQARQALLQLRKRFAGGSEATTAAFALGRLEFDEFRGYSGAAEWFRTYLNERPAGPMAREALGRLIEASQRAGDTAGAESAARRYLRDYPSGPHAELASRLVPTP
jgi:hypothetical protein